MAASAWSFANGVIDFHPCEREVDELHISLLTTLFMVCCGGMYCNDIALGHLIALNFDSSMGIFIRLYIVQLV